VRPDGESGKMDASSWFGAGGDGERLFCGRWRDDADDGEPHAILTVLSAAEHPTPDSLNRLTHEYVLKDDLDGTWATRPQRLVRAGVRIMLTLGFLGGQALDRLIGPRMEVGRLVSGWNGEELDLACP
jgi:hypothetical protein